MAEFDLFKTDANAQRRAAQMHALFGVGVEVSPEAERLSRALNDWDAAKRSDDPDEKLFAAIQVDRATAAAKAAQEQDRPRDPEIGQFVSFDGGPRRDPRQARRLPGMRQESANELFLRALTQSRVERQEAGGRRCRHRHEHLIPGGPR